MITKLSTGKHNNPSQGACVMEYVSILKGEAFSDHPACACPVLTAYAIALNDKGDAATRAKLLDLAPRLVDTRDPAKEQRRAYLFADRAVRVFAPIALEAAGLTEEATKLRDLPEIVDVTTARAAARAAVRAAAEAVWAAEAAEAVRAAAEAVWAAEAAWAPAWAPARAPARIWEMAIEVIVAAIEVE